MAALLHQRLSDAAKAGDINDLYLMLEQDSRILEVIDQNPFVDTPLHIAVAAGQACFVEEIINLKASFVRKLNPSGYSPLHLAATNGHVEIVKQLLTVDSCLAQLSGREKRIPLHCAAIVGSVEVLDELIFSCPKSLQILTVRKETALHLAVKHGQVETVKALLNWIRELNMQSILSWVDQEGNTVLHLATSLRHYQIVKMLCSGCKLKRAVNVNARNNSGLTALDLEELLRHPDESVGVLNISNLLQNAGSKRAHDLKINISPSPPTTQPRLAAHRRQRIWNYVSFRVPEDASLDLRNALLVILALIATTTFELGVNPPGGMWQDNSHGHYAGDSIWLSEDPNTYYIFAAANFAGFVLSSVLIIRLVEGYPYSGQVRLAQSLLVYSYVWSVPYNVPIYGYMYTLLATLIPIGPVAILWICRKRRQ